MFIIMGCLIPGTPEVAKGAVFGLFLYLIFVSKQYSICSKTVTDRDFPFFLVRFYVSNPLIH